jgi:hypothetical protein
MTAVTVFLDGKLSIRDKRDDFKVDIKMTRSGNWEF